MFNKLSNHKYFAILLFAFSFSTSNAQNVGINSTGAAPDASAMLDVASTGAPFKGLLIPRIALTSVSDVSTISSPATSLLVYNTTNNGSVTEGYYYYTVGGGWIRINTGNASVSGWGTSGTGSITTANFLGPTNSTPLIFKIAGTEYMRIAALGNVGIGTSTFAGTNAEKLLVDGSTTTNNIIVGKGNVNGYIQLNIINSNAGIAASTDVVATNDAVGQGSYIDMGINSSGNTSSGLLGGNNTAYLQSVGSSDLAIGNATSGKNLSLFTTTAGGALTERMRILPTGMVGINNSSPSEALDVTGNLDFSGALMPGNDAGAIGEVLVSSGAGAAPTWINSSTVLNGYAWLLTGNTMTSEQKLGTFSNYALPIYTNSVERMRILSTGKVGIGTATPAELLEVKGNALFGSGTTRQVKISNTEDISSIDIFTPADKTLRISNDGVDDGGSLQLKASDESYLFSFEGKGGFRYYSRNSLAEKFRVNDAGDIFLTTTATATAINANGNINSYYQMNIKNSNASTLASTDVVATNNVAGDGTYVNMGINSSGNTTTGVLGGGNTAYLQSVASNDFAIGNATASKNLNFFTTTAGGVLTERMRILPTGEVAIGQSTVTSGFKFEVAGSARATAWTVASDKRLKNNIKNLNYGLKDVLALQPVSYNWIDNKISKDLQLGLIAQDAKKVIPEIVSGDESKEMLSVNYTELIPVLINAIKEQQRQIDDLKKSDIENKLLIEKLAHKK